MRCGLRKGGTMCNRLADAVFRLFGKKGFFIVYFVYLKNVIKVSDKCELIELSITWCGL